MLAVASNRVLVVSLNEISVGIVVTINTRYNGNAAIVKLLVILLPFVMIDVNPKIKINVQIQKRSGLIVKKLIVAAMIPPARTKKIAYLFKFCLTIQITH